MLTKEAVLQKEREKLNELFKDVDPVKTKLVAGLIEDAAFLFAENWFLRNSLADTGMVKIHPERPELQKPIEAAKQYRQNVAAYGMAIKTLNTILSKDASEGDDEFDKFIRQANGGE